MVVLLIIAPAALDLRQASDISAIKSLVLLLCMHYALSYQNESLDKGIQNA